MELIGSIEIEKYAGEWIEIARKPFYFQRNCSASVAQYLDIEYKDGKPIKFKVKNSCIQKNNKISQAQGKAKILSSDNRSLNISFSFFTDFSKKINYQILYLDSNYSQAIVGSPDKKYLWVLSRDFIEKNKIDALVEIAKERGYDVSDLIFNNTNLISQHTNLKQ
ncbi:biotin transporter BioY [Helicobacter anseris]|uniref:Biotin transporter BioY n=1 Tax=Helicobacter anseris TaxID=375926 RepID=A0A3D8J9H1_9HELI|nr:lipocalin family protein [Helicobacter anseris]RDU73521.1 biotin transporter BioY [Helicobacter anseris]